MSPDLSRQHTDAGCYCRRDGWGVGTVWQLSAKFSVNLRLFYEKAQEGGAARGRWTLVPGQDRGEAGLTHRCSPYTLSQGHQQSTRKEVLPGT